MNTMMNRDFVMARLAVAVSRLNDGRDMALAAIQQCADAEDGETPEQRAELLDDAMMCCHEAATALNLARARFANFTKEELEACEDIFDEDDDEQPATH